MCEYDRRTQFILLYVVFFCVWRSPILHDCDCMFEWVACSVQFGKRHFLTRCVTELSLSWRPLTLDFYKIVGPVPPLADLVHV